MWHLISYILFPLSIFYNGLTWLRNVLYDIGILKTFEFDIPVISIGNIKVGGTGKTPVTAFLVDLILPRYQVATLSRGYARKTIGFKEVKENDTSQSAGDEALMLKRRYGERIGVYVCEDRAYAIPHILYERPAVKIIVLDDAFQHRRVHRDLNILLSVYERPFYKDMVLPSGRSREGRYAANRADCILFTKCPNKLPEDEKHKLETAVRRYVKSDIPVFFSTITYHRPEPVFKEYVKCSKNIILFTGIADPEPLKKHLLENYNLVEAITYPDHHEFSLRDIKKLIRKLEQNKIDGISFVCTEKDMVRMIRPEIRNIFEKVPVFFIPMKIELLDSKVEFSSLIFKTIETKTGVM